MTTATVSLCGFPADTARSHLYHPYKGTLPAGAEDCGQWLLPEHCTLVESAGGFGGAGAGLHVAYLGTICEIVDHIGTPYVQLQAGMSWPCTRA